MPIRTDDLPMRLGGVAVGLGFLGLGLFSLIGRRTLADAALSDRAFWYGVTMVIAGVCAIVASLTIKDLRGIWCRQPRRWWR